ncbi:hypothetical protein WJX74_010199 [Apatococcus lobatus]|uniref:Uncharacterized protein n=1 Tax=Apatococcus lobatus TaxID=904363 RepID=A0AAW1SFK0_9CHLO
MVDLDPEKSGAQFESWRLSSAPIPAPVHASLSSPVEVLSHPGSGYLQVRAAVQHNHLQSWAGRLLAFVCDQRGSLLRQLHPSKNQEGQPEVVLLPATASTAAARLNASLAVVETPAGPSQRCLASTGQDDLHLLDYGPEPAQIAGCISPLALGQHIATDPDTCHHTSAVSAVQPFSLLSACQTDPEDDIYTVVWTLTAGSQQRAALCRVLLITLAVSMLGADEGSETRSETQPQTCLGQLQVKSVRLLQESPLTPHAAFPTQDCKGFVVAAQPMSPKRRPTGNDLGSGRPCAIDDEDDDVDPRTLQQAVEQLAKFTSENVEDPGELLPGRKADLLRDPGPEDPGCSTHPACTLTTHPCIPPDAPATGAGKPMDVACHPYKLLACSCRGGKRLLGLVDDVDCALVEASAPDASYPATLKHLSSIPALTYVAEGKVQRKHVLLGKPGSQVAAVIVEGSRFAFVYYSTPIKAAYGRQQVLEIPTDDPSEVLGAMLEEKAEGPALHVLLRKSLLTYQL